MDRKPRIAVLIDADNASADKIELILGELEAVGDTSIRRAYGNWTKPGLKSWAAVLHENAIRPMQQYDYSSGKNASDMAMVIDAMALLYTDRPDAFAIVSSDADFTPLVMHLREKGVAVYGFGEQKTPEPFKTACSRFVVLSRAPKARPSSGSPRTPRTSSRRLCGPRPTRAVGPGSRPCAKRSATSRPLTPRPTDPRR